MATGEMRSHTVEVIGSEPLKITLVFTDEPAALGAAYAPVNDLDLEVIAGAAPEAPVYKGNVFTGGQSGTGGVFDPLNNVEMVSLTAPVPAPTRSTCTPGSRGSPRDTRSPSRATCQ